MSVVENIISMVVLMGLLLAAFVIITGLNVNFFSDVVDTSVKEYNTEKYQNDLDAVLNTTEPVSGSNYAGLLADAVYYRRKYFDYNAPSGLEINEEIAQYYNNDLWPDENRLQVDELTDLTFNKLYGKDNFYLEIKPLLLKLRLYFVIDGSASLENEVDGLKDAIPSLIGDFNSEFDVVARVFVLAGSELEGMDPCAELQTAAECKYLYEEEMYSNQVGTGWMIGIHDNNRDTLNAVLRNSSGGLGIGYSPSFSESRWSLSADEFLDDTRIREDKSNYFCSWVDLNKEALDNFQIQLDFDGMKAGIRMNSWDDLQDPAKVKRWHTAQSGTPISLINDLNTETNWQMICLGYGPDTNYISLDYRYILTPKDGEETYGYFKLNELFAFRALPKEYEFSPEIIGRADLGQPGGKPYEDWATGAVYAALTAEKENPSTMTVIIPISDELSTGSEAAECYDPAKGLNPYQKLFCERCNKLPPNYAGVNNGPFECPFARSGEDVNRAINIINQYLYYVYPVLADSCDLPNPYTNEVNQICQQSNFQPYGDCTGTGVYCGECFGQAEHEDECPGLTLPAPGDLSKGCDKKHCRDFIKLQMQHMASETGGEMIELSDIDMLSTKISEAIRESIEEDKIEAGVKRPEDERFAFKKVVPLSNKLFAELSFWHYKHAAGEK